VISLFKDKRTFLYLVLFLLSLLPFVGRFFSSGNNPAAHGELYKSELSRLDTPEKCLAYADSVYAAQHTGTFDTASYVATLSLITKQRFYHGSLDYTYSENWIAAAAGKFLWSHLSSIVIPEDILKHSSGLCSQQTIVLMKLLRAKNIDVRSVGLGYREGPGHFLCEVRYDGAWHVHDVSMEPAWTKIQDHHLSMNYYLSKKDSLFVVYESKLEKDVFFKLLEQVEYGDVNKMPAAKMAFFHRFTFALTILFPFLLLSMLIFSFKKKSQQVLTSPAKREITDFQQYQVAEKMVN